MRTQTLALYDSLPKYLEKYTEDNPLQPIKTFLQTHPDFKDSHWTIKNPKQYPEQTNGVDCGLFTCAAALCIIARQEMHFDHRHMKHFRTQLAQRLIDDSTEHSHVSDIPKEASAARQNTVSSQNNTHHPHQVTTFSREREEKIKREDGGGGRAEGERAGNPGRDPETPQREDQRRCDPHAAHSPSAPQGVAHQEQVKILSPSPKAGTGARPRRSTPKTSRSKTKRETQTNRTLREEERAGNPGSDPGTPQREDQRGCDPQAAHSPSAPQGAARQEQVKIPSPSPTVGTGATPRRSMPKTSRSKQPRQKHQKGRKPAPIRRNPQANKTQHQLTDFWNTPQPLTLMPRKPAATTDQLLSTTIARKATRDEDAST
jgi:hypothetical protein